MITILVVQDNVPKQKIMARFLTSIFGAVNVNIIIADNGQIGVDEFKKQQNTIDLIIMDHEMPVKNGLEAILEIKALKENVKILAWTSVTDKAIIARLKEAGAYENFISDVCNKKDIENLLQELQLMPTISAVEKAQAPSTAAAIASEIASVTEVNQKELATNKELITAMHSFSIHNKQENETQNPVNTTANTESNNIKAMEQVRRNSC